jgi:cytochrome c
MYFKLIVALSTLVIMSACDHKEKINYDGKKLLEQKCAKCHNLDLPPKTYEDEIAPPMMAVAFHVQSFMDVNDESMRIPKAIEFVDDYVMAPSASKSLCDEASLKSYGLMPSQKGNLTEDELNAIAEYLFEHYTQKNLSEAQALLNKLRAMPKGERLALQNNCLSCHKKDKNLVGPSFELIAKRYKTTPEVIEHSIENGSKHKWKDTHNAVMPAFKKLNAEQRVILREWILSL